MPSFARVAVNVPSLAGVFVDGSPETGARHPATFDYEVPESLEGALQPGHLVVAPFGSQMVQAVVLQMVGVPAVSRTRNIAELVDPEPVLTPQQIELAEWLAENTLQPLGVVIELFLPPGIAQQADTSYEIALANALQKPNSSRSDIEARLMHLLQRRGPLRGRQLDRALPHVEWRKTARHLVRKGLLRSRSVLPPAAVRPKLIRTAQLAATPDAARRAMSDLGRNDATRARRQKALSFLLSRPRPVSVSWVYAESGCRLADLQEMAERELIILREQEILRDPVETERASGVGLGHSAGQVEFTAEQTAAWQAIAEGLRAAWAGKASQPFLLQGVTGSGKTELYLRATDEATRAGRQVIMLVPEIALTAQTVDRFVSRFPGQVGLIHSRLSAGERYDTWRRARGGLLPVIIGPRSALFMPLRNLGLLIADECHDPSYHQSEPPFYDALGAAQAYARICRAVCIQGSATPSVVQRYQAETGRSIRLELRQRVASASAAQPATTLDLPPVQIVDMREELKAGNRSIFGAELKSALSAVIREGEQAILFLNRRGTATYVFCRNCGHVVRCPRCETPLTLHTTGPQALLCHRCGYNRQLPKTCPQCGSADIRAYGLGTEKVEAEAQRLFPGVRTLRWDWETTRQKDAHAMILHHFARGHADVLVGTQMLAKGLDLPRVTLVGVVLADAGIFLPDPFAVERVFQLLTQVAGRAGRSTSGGRVILQTFSPQHPAVQAAARHDVEAFYRSELEQRQRLGFPPFTRLLRLEYRDPDGSQAEETARATAARVRKLLDGKPGMLTALIGPAPCYFSKVDGKYRWQIVLRGAEFKTLLAGQRFPNWRLELDPASLL